MSLPSSVIHIAHQPEIREILRQEDDAFAQRGTDPLNSMAETALLTLDSDAIAVSGAFLRAGASPSAACPPSASSSRRECGRLEHSRELNGFDLGHDSIGRNELVLRKKRRQTAPSHVHNDFYLGERIRFAYSDYFLGVPMGTSLRARSFGTLAAIAVAPWPVPQQTPDKYNEFAY